ncbi:MAG: S8 family peptidase [Haloplanus sp.]
MGTGSGSSDNGSPGDGSSDDESGSLASTRRQLLVGLTAGSGTLGLGAAVQARGLPDSAGNDAPITTAGNNDQVEKGDPPARHIVGTDSPAATEEAKRRAKEVRHVLEFGDIGTAVAGRFPEPAREALERRSDVRYIEADGTMTAIGEAVPWGVDRVDADVAHDSGATGDGADIAILDTGIDSDHPDLTGNLGSGRAFVECGTAYDGSNCDGNGNTCHEPWDDDNDHGTHCAGIADAVDNTEDVIGVSTTATLHPVKVLGCSGAGYLSDIAAGIEHTTDQGWDVGSLSLGSSTDSSTIRDACQYAADNGVLLVAAAGNEGPCSDCVQYPAAYDTVVAVSATDSDDNLASFSSTGPEIELAAPGEVIPSTIPGGTASFSGTSMACPHVSGAGGLVMANGSSNTEARTALQDTAEDIGLSSSDGGYGLLDAEAAAKTTTMIGEAGTVTTDENWQTVTLDGSYTNPVVVTSVGTYNSSQPVHTRVRNAGSGSFEVRLEEWEYQDGSHTDETVHYVVMESGFHKTSTGINVLAGTVQADGSGWTTANYTKTLESQHYVFTQVMSVNDTTPVSTRVTDVGLDSFDVFCQEEEANRSDEFSDHAQETVGYLVTQPRPSGSGDPGESIASVFATDEWSSATLQDSYAETPVILHGLQSYFGRDTTDLRGRNYSSTSFEVLAEEEQSANTETNHVREYVATLALTSGTISTG